MFEGNDLSLAYGSYEQDTNSVDFQQSQPLFQQPSPQQQPQQQQQQQQQQFQAPPRVQPVVQPNINTSYTMPEIIYSQPQMKQPIQYTQNVSLMDKFLSKWHDVVKVISFALIIVLAISIDRFFTFYSTQYVAQSLLTTTQEVLVRIGYPIIIIIIIWIMKIV